MQIEEITFNNLPEAISYIKKVVVDNNQLLLELKSCRNQDQNNYMNISELSNYLPDKPTKNTIYSWIQKKSIPFHKGPKMLYFLKSEIEAWMKEGRNNSSLGPVIPPENYLKLNKKIKK